MKKLIQLLNQPHPGYTPGEYMRTVARITIVVFLILSILQPFNIGQRNINGNPYLTALVYTGGAAVTMCIGIIWLYIFPRWFKQKGWTLGKELVVLCYQILSIAATTWLIHSFRGTIPEGDATFTRSLFLVIAIGILPYFIATFIKHIYLLKSNLQQAEEMNSRLKSEHAPAEQPVNATGNVIINVPKLLAKVPLNEFVYAESKGNNLMVQSEKENKLICHTVRCTLNEFSLANKELTQLFRCHRSFIINTQKILQVRGNAAGYTVQLHPQLPEIVVARSNVEAFKKVLAGEN